MWCVVGTGMKLLPTLRVCLAKFACFNTLFSTCSVLKIFYESGTTDLCDDMCLDWRPIAKGPPVPGH